MMISVSYWILLDHTQQTGSLSPLLGALPGRRDEVSSLHALPLCLSIHQCCKQEFKVCRSLTTVSHNFTGNKAPECQVSDGLRTWPTDMLFSSQSSCETRTLLSSAHPLQCPPHLWGASRGWTGESVSIALCPLHHSGQGHWLDLSMVWDRENGWRGLVCAPVFGILAVWRKRRRWGFLIPQWYGSQEPSFQTVEQALVKSIKSAWPDHLLEDSFVMCNPRLGGGLENVKV